MAQQRQRGNSGGGGSSSSSKVHSRQAAESMHDNPCDTRSSWLGLRTCTDRGRVHKGVHGCGAFARRAAPPHHSPRHPCSRQHNSSADGHSDCREVGGLAWQHGLHLSNGVTAPDRQSRRSVIAMQHSRPTLSHTHQ